MKKSSRDALELLIEKVQEMAGYRFWEGLDKSRVRLFPGENRFEVEGPDRESVVAFCHTLRFFILQKEPSSFRGLEVLLDDPDVSDTWKQEYKTVRAQLNDYLDKPNSAMRIRIGKAPADTNETIESKELTFRDVLNVCLFGDISHAHNVEHRQLYLIMRGNGFLPLVNTVFFTILHDVYSAAAYMAQVSLVELQSAK